MVGIRGSRGVVIATGGLATGLVLSAVLLAAIGGWAGVALAVAQLVTAVVVGLRPGQSAPLATAALTLAAAPVSAIIHWTAELPMGCRCQRVANPPGLLSLTGLAVATDVSLIAIAVWLATTTKTSPGQP